MVHQKNAKRGRNDDTANTSTAEEVELPPSPSNTLPPVAGFPTISFTSQEQRDRFVSLSQVELTATRFLSDNFLRSIGLHSPLVELLRNTGMGSLVRMEERTYRELTLEFFSSFEIDENPSGIFVDFRMFNNDYRRSLIDFGTELGVWSDGYDTSPRPIGNALLWKALTGENLPDRYQKCKASHIQHPVVRLWQRLLGGTFFGRKEPNNMSCQELDILNCALNLSREAPIRVNVALWIAQHFQKLGRLGKSRTAGIVCGGVVTFIARKLVRRFSAAGLTEVGGSRFEDRIYGDTCLKGLLRWLSEKDGKYIWMCHGRPLVELPCSTLPPLLPLPQQASGETFPPTSYLLTGPRESSSAAAPSPSTTIDPSAGPSSSSSAYPPTYVPYPAFVRPRVVDPDTITRLQLQHMEDFYAYRQESSIALHAIYNDLARRGHISREARHPVFFNYPDDYPEADPSSGEESDDDGDDT